MIKLASSPPLYSACGTIAIKRVRISACFGSAKSTVGKVTKGSRSTVTVPVKKGAFSFYGKNDTQPGIGSMGVGRRIQGLYRYDGYGFSHRTRYAKETQLQMSIYATGRYLCYIFY